MRYHQPRIKAVAAANAEQEPEHQPERRAASCGADVVPDGGVDGCDAQQDDCVAAMVGVQRNGDAEAGQHAGRHDRESPAPGHDASSLSSWLPHAITACPRCPGSW